MFTNVWPTLPNRQGVLVTSELVRSIQDELDLEDGEVKDFSQEAPAAAPAETVAGKNPSGKNTGRRNLGSKG